MSNINHPPKITCSGLLHQTSIIILFIVWFCQKLLRLGILVAVQRKWSIGAILKWQNENLCVWEDIVISNQLVPL